eukprot:EG_transcript_7804
MPTYSPSPGPWGGGRRLSEPLAPLLPGVSPRPKSIGRVSGRRADLAEHPPPHPALQPLQGSNASQAGLLDRAPLLRASGEVNWSRRPSHVRNSGNSPMLPLPATGADADDPGLLEARVTALERLVAEKERQAARAGLERREDDHRREAVRQEEALWVFLIAHPSALLACEAEEAATRRGLHTFEAQCWTEQEQVFDRQMAVALQQHTVRQLAMSRQQMVVLDEEAIARHSLGRECWRDLFATLAATVTRQEVVGRLALDEAQFQALTALARTKASVENSGPFRQLREGQRRRRMAEAEREEAERRRKSESLLMGAFVRLLCGAVELEEEMRREWLEDALEGVVEAAALQWVEPEEALRRRAIAQEQSSAWTALCRYNAACKVAIRTKGNGQRQKKVLVLQRFARLCLARWEVRRRKLRNVLEDSEEEDHFQTEAESFRDSRPVGAIDRVCVTPILHPLPLQPQRFPFAPIRDRGRPDRLRSLFHSPS